jgi:hypothetical protein
MREVFNRLGNIITLDMVSIYVQFLRNDKYKISFRLKMFVILLLILLNSYFMSWFVKKRVIYLRINF